jgi:hypothetical protein
MLVYLDPVTIKAVKLAAVDSEVSASLLVERALEEWLARHTNRRDETATRDEKSDDERDGLIVELADRYVWWSEGQQVDRNRVLAQVMEIGTYDDIRRMEAVFTPADLRDVMLQAPKGAIGRRSWDFWRGRLRAAGCPTVPAAPPRRAFHAEML